MTWYLWICVAVLAILQPDALLPALALLAALFGLARLHERWRQ